MRITKLKINHWRNFANVELGLDNETSLICLVGANGTGKSHLLELIAACAHRLGLSQGIDIPRGDPFSDPHNFELQFYLAKGISSQVDQLPEVEGWDRTLTIESKYPPEESTRIIITAGGVTNPTRVAQLIIQALRQTKEVHFLSLDANRAYPKKNIHHNEIAQAYETDWEQPEYTRGRSYKQTYTLFDEWIKYFLAQENQTNSKYVHEIRRARATNIPEPKFVDQTTNYKEAIQKVLSHLLFVGVDSTKKTIMFDSTGLELSFDQLSGGEREIAFLIGQIDRFGLREGLFLLDEPELHLNSDLVRMWITYLSSTIETGQIWLATHSIEAVEAAGYEATFVLERNEETRKVDTLARLDTRPVLSVLSRAVGSPAFSISKQAFVFIEGEEGRGERECFRQLSGNLQNIRFIEGGSCNEVLRRVEVVKQLAHESQTNIRICGIIDRDFRLDTQEFKSQGIYVLSVHEVENFFLHPDTLEHIAIQNGFKDIDVTELILKYSDKRAGSWIFQKMMATSTAKSLPVIPEQTKKKAKSLTWSHFDNGIDSTIQSIVDITNYDEKHQKRLRKILKRAVNSYQDQRKEKTLWKICEGKEILNDVALEVGFKNQGSMIQAIFTLWERDVSKIPPELRDLRQYLTVF